MSVTLLVSQLILVICDKRSQFMNISVIVVAWLAMMPDPEKLVRLTMFLNQPSRLVGATRPEPFTAVTRLR